MQKALFLYSEATGQGRFLKDIDQIIASLGESFDLTVHKTTSQEDLIESASSSCGVYEVLIIAGGDGSFNRVLNAIAVKEEIPTLGYIAAGTISDIGKNFGITPNYKKAVKIIKGGKTTCFDIGRINGESYFAYVAAVGAYSDISYATPRKMKKRLGRVAYYTRAVGEAVKPKRVKAHIEADGKTYDVKTPFILLLNGKCVGGFTVNPKGSVRDGKMELYLTRPGLFNGLLHYLFFKAGVRKIVANDIKISTDIDMPWCLDGEKGLSGDIHVETLPRKITIFCAEKFQTK